MRTTVELSDELMRRVKVEAAREGKSMREFFVMALEMKLAGEREGRKERGSWPTVGNAGGPEIPVFSSEELDELLFS